MSDKEIKIDTVSVNDLDPAPTAGKAACTDSENIPGDKGGEPIDMAEQIEKLSAQVTELTDTAINYINPNDGNLDQFDVIYVWRRN